MYRLDNLKERFKDFHPIDKFRAYEKRGIVIGIVIALVVVTLVTIGIVKYLWLKKQFDGLAYDLDDLYDDEDFDEDEDCCDDGCCSAKDQELEKI